MNQNSKADIVDIKSNEYTEMYIRDGIFYMRYKPIKLLSIEIAKPLVVERLKFKKGVSYPSLFDITQVKSSTKEARDFLAREGNKLVTASAILTKSPMLRMMANFFIKVNKPLNPTQMFTDEEAAIQWLQQFK